MTKFKKQNALPCKFQKKFKGPLFHCREISDHKYWWSGKTLSVLSKSILKPGSFFIKFLTKFVWKLEKLKSQNFKSCMFDDQVMWTHLFHNLNILSTNWPLLKLCNSIKPNDRDICEIWKNQPLKCGFGSISQKHLKDRQFMVGESKKLEIFIKHLFWC